ncbi:hypothetical protein [Daejeonella oryzae]|uniref:hypothetical protein n=1 Tax=Daejeonella oryzae TaxID=1122943 RepID=UPI0003FC4FF6|nr:hypothetical protein [Daejeonella oryzae]
MENENLNPDNKTPQELEEIKRKKLESENKDASENVTTKEEIEDITKVSHDRGSPHSQPSRTHDKAFGTDHEPGTI